MRELNIQFYYIFPGIAHAEAIVFAATLLNINNSNKIGFDIRDSCGDPLTELRHCNDMSEEAISYKKNNTYPAPVKAVISSFPRDSLDSLNILTTKHILQISYSPENARLNNKNPDKDQRIAMLVSAFPEKTNRMVPVAAFIKKFGWQYVHAAVSKDIQGEQGFEVLKKKLSEVKACTARSFLFDEASIRELIKEIKEKPLIKVVVIHTTEASELSFYKALNAEDFNHLIIITTADWSMKLNYLKSYPKIVEGMVYLSANSNEKFNDYIGSLNRNISFNKPWLNKLYQAECLVKPLLETKFCNDNEVAVLGNLKDVSADAIYSFNSVYAVASAENKRKDGRPSLVEAMSNLSVRVNYLDDGGNPYLLYFSEKLTAVEKTFSIYNVQLNMFGEYAVVRVGSWTNQSELIIDESKIRWKNDTKSIPQSLCSADCLPGFKRTLSSDSDSCCWTCEVCPYLSTSNVTNAGKCIECNAGETTNPNKTFCRKYNLIHMTWSSGGVGSLVIFLIFIGCVSVLFAVVIFTVKFDHEIVKRCNYNVLLWFLFGCLIIFFSPIPLLNKPTVSGCSVYIAFLNFGLTIVFSALYSRSAFINEKCNNESKICGLISPRLAVIFVLNFVQFLILVIGLNSYPPKTNHNETEIWYVRWFECSNWSSHVWWVAFGYNIALSIAGNFLSCWSTKMNENSGELQHIAKSYCVFYLLCLIEIVILYKHINKQLEESQAVMTFVMAFSLFIIFIGPKLFIIYFKTERDGKTVDTRSILKNTDSTHHQGAIHTRGFSDHDIVQLEIKGEMI